MNKKDIHSVLADIAKKAREISRMAEELKDDEQTFLRNAGWEYTCATPGSAWLWTRKIIVKRMYHGVEERVYEYNALCSRDEAISMTRRMINEAIAEGRTEL